MSRKKLFIWLWHGMLVFSLLMAACGPVIEKGRKPSQELIFRYVPFSAWVPIPDPLSAPLRLGTPLVILAIAVATALRSWRATGSVIRSYAVLAIVDAVLSLLVYGVNLLGAF